MAAGVDDGLRLAPLRPHDHRAAARLLAEAMARNPLQRARHGLDDVVRLERMERHYAALLRQHPGVALTARRERALVGVAAWRSDGKAAVLEHLGVAPLARGAGVGSALLDAFLADADARRAAAELETDAARTATWFARRGFHVVSERHVLGVACTAMRRGPRGHLRAA